MSAPEPQDFCPYIGLQPYTETDAAFFFGRERDQRVITSNLYASPLTILYGASGVGKSSVLLAGVVPKLRATPHTAVVVFRTWQDTSFVTALKTECLRAIELAHHKPLTVDLALPFDDFVAVASQQFGGAITIIFDQFEEYFLYHPSADDPNSFDAEFARTINRQDVDAPVLISLREDGLSKLDRFRTRIPNLLGNTLRLRHLDLKAAGDAITKPLAVYNQRFPALAMTTEPELVHQVLTQVSIGQVQITQTGAGQANEDQAQLIETPFLQLVMTRLWEVERNDKSNVLRLATLERLGGAQTIVRTHLDRVMQQLSATDQEVCSSFFDRLVTPSGAKVAQLEEDLIKWADRPADQVKTVLKTLSDARVLRPISPPPDQPKKLRYEIFHDVLAPAMLNWRNRYIARQERERAQREEQARRVRLIRTIATAIGSVLLLVFISLTVYAFQQRGEAEAARKEAVSEYLAAATSEANAITQRNAAATAQAVAVREQINAQGSEQKAFARELAFSAIAYLDEDPERSLLLAQESLNRIYTTEGENALRTSLINSRVRVRLEGHTAAVMSAVFSPDDQNILTASQDGTARVWDVKTSKTILVLNANAKSVNDAEYSPDGKFIITAHGDGKARIWNAVTGQLITELSKHTDSVNTAVYSSDGKFILTASSDKTAILWDTATTSVRYVLNDHSDAVNFAGFSPDNKLIVTAGNEGIARLWDTATGKQTEVLIGDNGALYSAAFNPAGDKLVVATGDRLARIWDLATQKSDYLRGNHTDAVYSAIYTPDGKRVLTASADHTILNWNLSKLDRTGYMTLIGHTDEVRRVAYSHNGRLVVTASTDKTARIWDAYWGTEALTLIGHTDKIWTAVFSPDGKQIASASFDGTVRIWDAATGDLLNTFTGHKDRVWFVNFSPDGKQLVSASTDQTARIWDIATGREIGIIRGHNNTIYSAVFSPDGKRIVTASLDKTARVWDVATGKQLVIFDKHTDSVRSAFFSPDGKRIVTSSWDNTARIWNAETGNQLVILEGHAGFLTGAEFSSDGKKVVTASIDTTAKIWESETGKLLITLTGHKNSVFRASFSPDGKLVVTASPDTTTRLWDTETGKEMLVLRGHTDVVNSAYFSANGTKIVTASDDQKIHVYLPDIQDLRELAKQRSTRPLDTTERCKYLQDLKACGATPTPKP